jgi:hypothetical protein
MHAGVSGTPVSLVTWEQHVHLLSMFEADPSLDGITGRGKQDRSTLERSMSQWIRGTAVSPARRRRSKTRAGEHPLITLPRAHNSYVAFDAHAFRNAMNVLVARSPVPFTVLILRPTVPDATLGLAEVVLSELRAGSGDLAGCLESAVGVALHGGREGAHRFLDRVCDRWHQLGGGELLVEMAEYPLEEQRAVGLLTTDWSAESWLPFVTDESATPQERAKKRH